MEEDLIAYLLADGPLLVLVGQRIYWNARPQASALPSVTLQRISSLPTNDEEGADSLTETRVQMDAWGSSFSSALAVARAIEAALSGRSFIQGTTSFRSIYIEGAGDTTEPGTGGVIHRSRIDFQIWHS